MRIFLKLMTSLKSPKLTRKKPLSLLAFEAGFDMKRQCPEMLPMRLIMLSLFFIAAIISGGCESFVIQGKVVQGSISTMNFVSHENKGLDIVGLAGAKITVYRNPDSLSTKVAGTAISDDQGRFVIKLDDFGAGWMIEQWNIIAQKRGYANVFLQQSLTSDHEQQTLLVTMTPGYSQPVSRDALWKQYQELHQPGNTKTNK